MSVVKTSLLNDKYNEELRIVLSELISLRNDILTKSASRLYSFGPQWPDSEREFSAINLCHYLAFRQHDIRPLQERLTKLGLSSLGRGEADILNNIENIIRLLIPLVNADVNSIKLGQHPAVGSALLMKRSDSMFGQTNNDHYTKIMVTMPALAADSDEMIDSLIQNDISCARINCAHDATDVWDELIAKIKQTRSELGSDCKIFMDLAGIKIRTGPLGYKPRGEAKIRLFKNDLFELSCDAICSVPGNVNPLTDEETPAIISCTNNIFMKHIRVGEYVWFDDGKMGCVVEAISQNALSLRVKHVGPRGLRIKPDKGINFPDTRLDVPALTDKDLQDLDYICSNADIVGISFLQSAEDLECVIRELEKRQAKLPIVAKIETNSAVINLPEILLKGLSYDGEFAIMIARGDLAVELGSVRMAEIQEEILWICESAHIPVIWATQVLETLAKKGIVSRPEITDAAMSVRAECVMLNKGPYIAEAVIVLRQILDRMQAHQYKKVTRLRALHW